MEMGDEAAMTWRLLVTINGGNTDRAYKLEFKSMASGSGVSLRRWLASALAKAGALSVPLLPSPLKNETLGRAGCRPMRVR